ncbi:islet cell autoantigen 1-like [Tetranychus urticae]|uniref:AH domain-containing protein n=1 Tax=Tetranychus urticae TaxID=32264 RepID=T1KL68_TETUR|nr:islet cell autoantigen 1-like [Tetranychus urticae]
MSTNIANNPKPGISGQEFDKFVEREDRREDDSTFLKMQQRYWEAKQTFISKLKRKEDDCVVASDAPLDAKLELFRSIEETCCSLLCILEGYQDRLCTLAHEENSTGRFLKECGKIDKTRAGKMMTASGKTLCYTAQQRIQLRNPLVRLYQEVETFQYRAIADTMITIEKMEKARLAYRAALLWMKDLSQQLDPDTYKQLEKFRKVQGQVRRTKSRFDKLKLDTLQKIDMLSASRCNMFSHALVLYQKNFSTFWEKSSKAMKAISDNFKGYQHYEFSFLKDLTETSKKLAQEDNNSFTLGKIFTEGEEDKDSLIFFESEYHDDDTKGNLSDESTKVRQCTSGINKNHNYSLFSKKSDNKDRNSKNNDGDVKLIDMDIFPSPIEASRKQRFQDLLDSQSKSDDNNLLSDIFSIEPVKEQQTIQQSPMDSFFPSHLMDIKQSNLLNAASGSSSLDTSLLEEKNKSRNSGASQAKDNKKNDWFNLFAELDPLANPDALVSRGKDDERNC